MLCFMLNVQAQRALLVAGPMLGHTELRTTKVWVQFAPVVNSASIEYISSVEKEKWKQQPIPLTPGEFNTATVNITGLEPGTEYQYRIKVKGREIANGSFSTQSLWQWRNDPPDFNFLAGSCAFFNEPAYDRPRPYGMDSSIFQQMALEKSSFMLWLGDNWYTRESDYYSDWGLYYRASRDRSFPVLQPLLKAMPNYATWDDHDYGPNNSDKSYIFKETARKVFSSYWANPSYGQDGQGIYSNFIYNDVEIFLLDDRWWRSNDEMHDSLHGQPLPGKKNVG
jgi:alkaline phosphatase D